MEKLNILQKIDNKNELSNYKKKNTEKNNELALFISENFNKLTFKEKKIFVLKCLNETKVNNILLKFELENLNVKKINNFNKYIKIAHKLLNRYQSRAGGFLIEDNEWILHTSESSDYEIKQNQIVFENSVAIANIRDYDTINFLKKILSLLKRLSDNVIVSEEFIKSKKDGVVWILFKCEFN